MHNRFSTHRPLRYAMVGGGPTSQIGDSHRVALARDHYFDLVAGAFDADPVRGRAYGIGLGLDPKRVYADYRALADAEGARADGVEVVAVMTPNATHHAIARALLEAGMHVIVEKPVTTRLADALALDRLARERGLLCAAMYGYTGYPMVRQARAMVAAGLLGEVRVVHTEFAHGNCAVAVERDSEGARWRNDPAQSGETFVLADVGTHAVHLATYVAGQDVSEVACDRHSFVAGRVLEDNAHVMLRFAGGAAGFLWASGVATGRRHGLALRVYGSRAGLVWEQEHPGQLQFTALGESPRTIELDGPEVLPAARRLMRVGAGHPEGYFEAFANVYADIAAHLLARREGREVSEEIEFPTVADGAAGVAFLEACVASAARGSAWTEVAR